MLYALIAICLRLCFPLSYPLICPVSLSHIRPLPPIYQFQAFESPPLYWFYICLPLSPITSVRLTQTLPFGSNFSSLSPQFPICFPYSHSFSETLACFPSPSNFHTLFTRSPSMIPTLPLIPRFPNFYLPGSDLLNSYLLFNPVLFPPHLIFISFFFVPTFPH